jgi:RND family efflux transporter MFP subunit
MNIRRLCGDVFRCLLGCGLLAAVPAMAGDIVEITARQAATLGVKTVSLAEGRPGKGVALPAQVAIPNSQLHVVSAPLAGLVQSALAAAGQTVKKGQVLVRLQSPALIEAQRDFLHGAVQARLARETLARDEKLFKEGIIAESRYLAAKSAFAQAAATLNERRQALRLFGMSDAAIGRLEGGQVLRDTVDLVAPTDGVVLEQSAVAGQRVEAGAPLYTVARPDPLWLEIQVPVQLAAGLREGAAVTVPAYQAAGKILYVGKSVNPANQTVMARGEITEGAQNLRAGQFVEAEIAAARAQANQWRVPNAALVRDRGKVFVFVQTPAGFRPEPVDLISETAEGALIGGPFRGTERIAVSGIAALKGAWMGLGGSE